MPYIIKNLSGSRRDPNRRKRGRGTGQPVGNPAKLKIGTRVIKQGKRVSVSDAAFEDHEQKIMALVKMGIISVHKTGPDTDWKPEPVEPEIKETPVVEVAPVEEAPEPAPVEAEPEVAEEPAPEPEPEPEPEPAPEPVAEEKPKKTTRRRGRRKKAEDE